MSDFASYLRWLRRAGLAAVLLPALIVPVMGQESNESRYISNLNASLDSLIAKLSNLPQQPVVFSSNLIFAHGLGIAGAPTPVLLQYIDALKAAGAQRVEFNPGITSVDNPEVMDKYEAVVKHIRDAGMKVQINLEYARVGDKNSDLQVQRFRDYAAAAVKACAQFAARYHPDYLVPVHEPMTMMGRSGVRATPEMWVAYLNAALRAIKRASPHTLVGAGAFYRELPYFQAFANVPELDFLTIDIYDQNQLNIYDQMIQNAHAVHKPVFIEETWRPAFTGPLHRDAWVTGVESHTIKGAGSADFQDVDLKWMKAMVLYAATHGVESITPFYSQTFFAYVSSGPDKPTDREYNERVRQALAQGQRTKTFDEYRALEQKYGRKSGGSAAPLPGGE